LNVVNPLLTFLVDLFVLIVILLLCQDAALGSVIVPELDHFLVQHVSLLFENFSGVISEIQLLLLPCKVFAAVFFHLLVNSDEVIVIILLNNDVPVQLKIFLLFRLDVVFHYLNVTFEIILFCIELILECQEVLVEWDSITEQGFVPRRFVLVFRLLFFEQADFMFMHNYLLLQVQNQVIFKLLP
jgi:hypothetical protein